MKKKLISLVILMLLTVFIPLTTVEAQYERRPKQKDFNNIMSTTITVGIYIDDTAKRNQIFDEIGEMFTRYQILTDNFKKYDSEGNANNTQAFDETNVVYNVAYINENINTKIKIDKDLYTILDLSEQYKIETKGYFDISIGLIIDKWKSLMDLKEEERLTNKEFDNFVNEVKSIPVIEDGILLEKEEDNYYVTIKEGVKIDLGAIAKGYIVELAADIIKSYNIKHFEVGGSNSSLYFGEFPDPEREDGLFKIGILSPDPKVVHAAKIAVKNTSVGSSGDVVQYYLHNGYKYHHIVSPKTKMPEQFRSLVTIIGPDAGKVDVLTTALMNMDDNTFYQWIVDNPTYSALSFTYNEDQVDNTGCSGSGNQSKVEIIPIILISVIVVSIGGLVVANYYKNKNKDKANE